MNRRRGWMLRLSLAGVTAWPIAARAQSGFNPVAQLWPTSTEPARPALTAFGSAVACASPGCLLAPSFGLDARVVGPFRVAVAGPRSALQYGVSYAWNHIDIATRIGGGTLVAPPVVVQRVQESRDQLGRVVAETAFVDTSGQSATRWTSAEARLTWRESRWWVTAIAGRMSVAKQGAGLWGGLQLGADIGRGASLLLGTSTSRLFASSNQPSGQGMVSFGLGFNAGLFSRQSGTHGPTAAAQTFVVSPSAPGRIRVAIRVPGAASVEFASDCTGWTPVRMQRSGDAWIVDVPATAGLHHANIRVDGGRWVAPPGLPPADDDFAGEVGIFVVQ